MCIEYIWCVCYTRPRAECQRVGTRPSGTSRKRSGVDRMMKLFVFCFFPRPLSFRHVFFPARSCEKPFSEMRYVDYRYNIYSIYYTRIKIRIVLYYIVLDGCFFLPTIFIVLKVVFIIGGRYVTQYMCRSFWIRSAGRPWEFLTVFFPIWIIFCLFFYASLHAVAACIPPFVSIRIGTQRWPAPYVYYVIGRYRRNTRTKNRVPPPPIRPPFPRLNKKHLSTLPFACRFVRNGGFSEE